MEEVLINIIRRRGPNGIDIDRDVIRGVILRDIFPLPPVPEVPVVERFDLNAIEDKYVKLYFRFERGDIHRLVRALRIPDRIRTRSRFVATGIDVLCILLRRLAYPSRLCDLELIFKRSTAALSEISNSLNVFISETHGGLLEDLGQLQWLNREKLNYYSERVTAKGAAVQNCWAFINGTARPICRPTEQQQEYYSGHKRVHCIKYQSLICPDGIIVSLLGAYPGRRHDAFIFGESGLYDQLERYTRFGDEHFVIYGDQAYGIRELCICPYLSRGITEAQQNFNITMSTVRQAVEWGFGKIVVEFAFLDLKKNQKLQLQDLQEIYKTAVILTNCHTTIYGSQTGQFFDAEPVELEQYLNEI